MAETESRSAQVNWLEGQPRTAPEFTFEKAGLKPRRGQGLRLLKGKVQTQPSRILPALSWSCFLTVPAAGRA